MDKYLWYSEEYGISDDFSTEEECIEDAKKQSEKNPSEYSIYVYDDESVNDDELDIDDCTYICFVSKKE